MAYVSYKLFLIKHIACIYLVEILSGWPQVDMSLTEDGHDDVVLDDLDGAPRDEVEGDDDVALVHQRVTRGARASS